MGNPESQAALWTIRQYILPLVVSSIFTLLVENISLLLLMASHVASGSCFTHAFSISPPLLLRGFYTRMMPARALGRVFSSLLPTLPTAPTLGVSPPSVPSEELVEVQDTGCLTSLSINGEYRSKTF